MLLNVLVVVAMTLLSFIAIMAILLLRGGVKITLYTNQTPPPDPNCPPQPPQDTMLSADELRELQEKADKEYAETTKALKDMSQVIQEFMCAPEPKGGEDK